MLPPSCHIRSAIRSPAAHPSLRATTVATVSIGNGLVGGDAKKSIASSVVNGNSSGRISKTCWAARSASTGSRGQKRPDSTRRTWVGR